MAAAEIDPRAICEGILAKINTDLGTSMLLNTREPTYFGNPEYVAAYPCIVMPPPQVSLEGYGGDRGASHLIGDLSLNHQLIYVYKATRNVDPYPELMDKTKLVIDWLIASMINRDFPKDDSNVDLFHFYVAPYIMRITNEYDDAFRKTASDANIHAGVVEFGTRKRTTFTQISA